MLKKEKAFGKDNESEASKLTEQKRFSMSTSSDTTDKKTVIGEHSKHPPPFIRRSHSRGRLRLLVNPLVRGSSGD